MTQDGVQNGGQNPFSALNGFVAGLNSAGTEQTKRFGEFQAELMSKADEINRHWIERFQTEAKLATDLASQIAGARTPQDALSLYRQWANERLKTAGDDASYAISAGRELLEAASRAFAGRTNGAMPST